LLCFSGYFPAAIACAAAFARGPQQQLFILVAMLLNPALLLIDHGHFQYNCISLGLAVRPLCCTFAWLRAVRLLTLVS
jgi:hypothetical protein